MPRQNPGLTAYWKVGVNFWQGYSRAFLCSRITYDACDVNCYYITIIQSPSTARSRGALLPHRKKKHPPIQSDAVIMHYLLIIEKNDHIQHKGCDLKRTKARSRPYSTGLMISPSSCLSMLFGSMTRQENTIGDVEFTLTSATAIKRRWLAAWLIDDSVVTL